MHSLKIILNVILTIIKYLILPFIVLLILDEITKGRLFNITLYLLIIGLGTLISFLTPVLIFWLLGSLYQKLDPDVERGFWIGGALKAMGIFEGLLNTHSNLHNHKKGTKEYRIY